MTAAVTHGVHHIGLTVADPEVSAEFFIRLLGWKEVRRDQKYPAIFVSDGVIMLTLWAAKGGLVHPFDRRSHIGLHHLALQVADQPALEALHQHLVDHRCVIEFAPELLREGPAMHMMCYEPGGIRIEFIWPGQGAEQ
ncbi:VOC family protein [Mariprofundus erugo]|uniref:VOC family protein n=1 Tax=Mariprofundus erugo TaxID=2528639 RepID=A0A5R9GXT4_9PROT|nr:VOC family protein [Mariprofundus erugo]TLS67844.1 VOC family protein [Mariprofundus erugo]